MSQNSSTSSSEYRRYFSVLLGTTLVLLVAVLLLNFVGLRQGISSQAWVQLLQHQNDKNLAAAGSIDTVFVGDSSLGNGISSATWSQLSGQPSLNLALTGSFGFGGSLNMLRRTLEQHAVRTVVVMQTADLMTRPFDYQGYIQTARGQELLQVPIREMLRAFLNWDGFKGTVSAVMESRQHDYIEHDYIRQGTRLDQRGFARQQEKLRLVPVRIDTANLRFLREIGAVCREHRLQCVYAHGPLVEQACTKSASYFVEVNAHIRASGLEPVPGTPVCVPVEDLGDSIDHVRPELKDEYTRRYHQRIATLLVAR
jgi:hypothetical protein